MVPYHIRALAAGALVLAVGIPFGTAAAAQACDDGQEQHSQEEHGRDESTQEEHGRDESTQEENAQEQPTQEQHALDQQTLSNLQTSMKGEAYAYATYTFFAAQADREHYASVGALFRSTANVELDEHFMEEADMSGLVGSDEDNLQNAMEGEDYESRTMYPTFAEQARKDGEKEAADLFAEIAKDEGKHRDAFAKALEVLRTGKGTIPAPPAVDVVDLKAGLPKVHAKRTLDNLDTAIHGEALAHAKYVAFGKHAAQNGNEALARLFNGASMVELKEHLAGEGHLYGLVRSTRENLKKAIAGEVYESRTMYPGFAEQAREVGDDDAAELFDNDASDEAGHARAFQKALDELK
jgi:rubrerythrin